MDFCALVAIVGLVTGLLMILYCLRLRHQLAVVERTRLYKLFQDAQLSNPDITWEGFQTRLRGYGSRDHIEGRHRR